MSDGVTACGGSPPLRSLSSFCLLMVLYSLLRLLLVFRCWTLWVPKTRTSRAVSTVETEPDVVDKVSDSSLSAGRGCGLCAQA